jgi:serine/threonine-protein kinase
LAEQTQSLLRLRLRASALLLLLGFGLFLVRHIVGALTGEPLDPRLLGFHILIVLVLSAVSVLLSPHRAISIRKLFIAELIIFGLPAMFFVALEHREVLAGAHRGYVPGFMSFWPLLIFTYGMFIPRSGWRNDLVVGAMALTPILLILVMMRADSEVAAVMTVVDLMQHLLVPVITAAAAVSGMRMINALRREAFEARQLAQYRLIAPLGSGAMGQVYLAEHRMLKRPCAVKLIRREQAGDPRVLARFEREVRMTARLSHWNSVEVFDYGHTDDGTFFYVMEYLPGLNLQELLERHGPVPAARVVNFLQQACRGLHEAHSIGLIHRDIKPANLFVAQRGGQHDVVKLLDFGLVKPVAEMLSSGLTQEGAISGTPLFMSPEQARGTSLLDARSDIYSLGAVGYTLLCGRPPFERTNPLDVLIAHARDEAAPLATLRSDIPEDVERVILRCLAKQPEDRFPDANSLEHALAVCGVAEQWTQSEAARWWERNQPTTDPLESRMPAGG